MLQNMFLNGVLLVAFLSIGSQVFRGWKIKYLSLIAKKIILGIYIGSIGCLLMRYSMHLYGNVILDLRDIAIIIAALYAGMIPAIIAGAIIGVFRIVILGFSNSAILAAAITFIISLICGFISTLDISLKKKWVYSLGFSLTISSILIVIEIDNPDFLLGVLPSYWLMTLLIAIFVYYYAKFLFSSRICFKSPLDESAVDSLTGLNNIREFDYMYNKYIDFAKGSGQSFTILYIDIDSFKKINDEHGYFEGDSILKQIADILVEKCRDADVVSRNGGQEFSIILLGCALNYAREVAERIREAIEKKEFVMPGNKKINITVSIGVASYPESTKESENLIVAACDALYRAKHSGKNKVAL